MTEQRAENTNAAETQKIPLVSEGGVIRVDTGIVSVNSRLRHFLAKPATYEQSHEAQSAVLKSVDPSILKLVEGWDWGSHKVKQLPVGTRAVISISYPNPTHPDISVFRLGGVILDSNVPVGTPHFTYPWGEKPLFYNFPIVKDKDWEKKGEKAQDFLRANPKFLQLLSQGAVQFELNKIRDVELIIGVEEITRGRFNNLSEYLAWLEPGLDKAWNVAMELKRKLEAAGKLRRDTERAGTIIYRQEFEYGKDGRDYYRDSYSASFSRNSCTFEYSHATISGSRTDSFTLERGKQLSDTTYSLRSVGYTTPVVPGGQSIYTSFINRTGTEQEKVDPDPNKPVLIRSRIDMFDEFAKVCDEVTRSVPKKS
ncbi:MAG: hypothetical protein ABSE17_02055 [Candidatus Levyibacteriota bacterium]